MPNEKTDKQGFNTNQPDVERTVASQGGPATGLGDPSNRVAPAGSDVDATTRAAAMSTDNKKENTQKENTDDEQIDEMQSDGNMGMPEGK
jgi:hypothetical protein